MKKRTKRISGIVLGMIGASVAVYLILSAFESNLMYFYSPTEIANGDAKSRQSFRVGGLVVENSISRAPNSLEVSFVLTDLKSTQTVRYTGILPDLFREGQGIIANGSMGSDGTFNAFEVLAKHDENYMPPEIADTLHTEKLREPK
ncbi:MAG: cytochrome c biogenesis protein CcmE [Methylococcaceae bacterium TMED69]|nr:MAG: cytochrome c biogenesis protein CcmE [Methylococcaceae bacterium TMED69]|tara:strand:- start:974 stop:1411 length:438 start_codon:yes stop_codon:yes gene_type:complete